MSMGHTVKPVSEVIDRLERQQGLRLSVILSRLESGDDTVLITPIGKRVGPEELFDSWKRKFDSNSSRMNSVLLEIEHNQMSKYGPRSIAQPYSSIKQDVISTFESRHVKCDHLDPRPLNSEDRGNIRPIAQVEALSGIKRATNSGLPYLMRTNKVLNEIYDNLKRDYEANWPTVPFVRTQELGKTRVVNGQPKSDIIIESAYFVPLFNYYRKLNCYSAMIGPSEVNTKMTRLLSETVRLGLSCVSGDIEFFDRSVQEELQDLSFSEMRFLINSAYHPVFNEIAYRFGTKPMILPDGVYYGKHGIPSGSQFTNLVGSIANRKVCNQPIELSQFLGDDFATATHDPQLIFSRYEDCGLQLNKDKTVVSSNYYLYLQNLFHPDYMEDGEIKGVYPTFRALNRLVYPERFTDFESYELDGKSYFALRSLSILENCRYHPMFEEFVKWWLAYEKYAIPQDKSISNYVKYVRDTTGTLGTANQIGDNVTGLTSWRSFQIAVRLA
jgi:hypothetical protein